MFKYKDLHVATMLFEQGECMFLSGLKSVITMLMHMAQQGTRGLNGAAFVMLPFGLFSVPYVSL